MKRVLLLMALPVLAAAQPDLKALKHEAAERVDARRVFTQRMVDSIFSFAELGFQEFDTSAYVTGILEKEGFRVTRGVAGMPTAWVAEWGSGKPVIGFMADIDGLPETSQKPGVAYHDPLIPGGPGHGEGHNAGQAVNVTAALAVKEMMQKHKIAGTIRVYPGVAEELLASRTYMVNAGLFRDLDVMLSTHIGNDFSTVWGPSGSGLVSTQYSFHGQSAHAAGAPWAGRSALDAVELMDVAWNFRREHLRPEQRSHYVIVNGGDQPNVVPPEATVWYFFREWDYDRIRAMHDIGNNDEPRDEKEKGDRSVLMCFDEKDGKFLWQFALKKLDSDIYLDWPRVGLVSPVTVEGDRLYFVSNRAEVRCLDLDGKPVWTFDMVAGAGIHPHDAAHGSVLIDGPYLYVNTATAWTDASQDPRARRAEPDRAGQGHRAAGGAGRRADRRRGSSTAPGRRPRWATVDGRTLVFFGGGDGVCYAFEALDPAAPALDPVTGTADGSGVSTATRRPPRRTSIATRATAARGRATSPGCRCSDKDRVYVAAGGDIWHGKPRPGSSASTRRRPATSRPAGEVWSYPLSAHCMSTPAVRDGLVFIVDCRAAGPLPRCPNRQAVLDPRDEGRDVGLAAGGRRQGLRRHAAGRFLDLRRDANEKKLIASVEFDSPICSHADRRQRRALRRHDESALRARRSRKREKTREIRYVGNSR